MGLKRKLSFDDSPPPSSTPAPSLPSSSQDSPQPETHPSTRAPALNVWNIAGAPYFNSRTRKRFRDNRPDSETIHERTLQKLYSAQKQLQHRESDDTRQTASHVVSADTPRHPRYHANAQMISGTPVRVETTPEQNQQSLDAFFAGSRPGSTRASSSSQNMSCATAALQPPLPSSLYQPNETAPSLVPPHPHPLPSVLTCEDCYAPLLTKQSVEAIDAEMLDVDGLDNMVDSEIEEGWQCALCAKRVCDTCAVRGDNRVCLECAVLGGGRYHEDEFKEKRWIGGVG
jgi:hypothetical protein